MKGTHTKYGFVLVLLLLITLHVKAQKEERGTGDELLKHEWGIAPLVHTDGYGLTFRNPRFITYYRKWSYEIGMVYMKHPKEVRTVNSYYPNTKSFIYGKKNYLFITRAGLGMQRLLNREPLWGGIQVRLGYIVGLSLGITKPVYLYIIEDDPSLLDLKLNVQKYKPDVHGIWDIHGRGPFTKGFDELNVYPGIYGKLGFNFEFAREKRKIRALEAGVIFDGYGTRIPIMAKNENKQFYLSFYISLYFGSRYN